MRWDICDFRAVVDANRPSSACSLLCVQGEQLYTQALCLDLQLGFVPDDVSNIIKESIDTVLQNQQYSEQKVSRCLP